MPATLSSARGVHSALSCRCFPFCLPNHVSQAIPASRRPFLFVHCRDTSLVCQNRSHEICDRVSRAASQKTARGCLVDRQPHPTLRTGIVDLAGARVDNLEQLLNLVVRHLLAEVRQDVLELADANVARHILVKDLETAAVLLRVAGVAEAAGPVQDTEKGLEVDWRMWVLAGVYGRVSTPTLRRQERSTHSRPRHSSPDPESLTASGSVRMPAGDHRGCPASPVLCLACRTAGKPPCSLSMPANRTD